MLTPVVPVRALRRHALALAALALLPNALLASTGHRTYGVVQRWTLPGAGGWDYLTFDAQRHRLFITRGNRVEVIATETGQVVGRILDTEGVHGVALAPGLHRGFTSNGRANSITEFNYDTLMPLRTVAVPGANPDAILYDANRNHLFVFNGRSQNVAVFDAKTLDVVQKLSLPGRPEFAVEDGRGHLFVNIESENGQLVEIDEIKLEILATWALPGCANPSGLALDTARERLFSVCEANVMAVTDARTGASVARVRIGDGPDAAAFDPTHNVVFSSNGEGTLTIVDSSSRDRYPVLSTVVTQRGARTMALDPVGQRIYLVTSDFGPAPAASAEHPHPRPQPLPDTFTVLVVAPK